MKRKLFVIAVIAFALVVWGFMAADQSFAQTSKPAPLTPLADVVYEPDGSFSAWCGQDFLIFRFQEWEDEARLRVLWFHNDPRARLSRSFGYALYDVKGNLRVSTVTPFMGPGEAATPAAFHEDPAGFWRTYVHRTGTAFKATDHPGISPIVVVFFFRNKDAVCPLRRTIYFGKG